MAPRLEKFGDWAKARRVFDGMAFRVRDAAEAGMREDAEALARRLRHNILYQVYAPSWPSLADRTIDSKVRRDADLRMLVDGKSTSHEGRYVDAIEAFKTGAGVWNVGVRDETLAKIGLTLEYGGGKNIPARPHWRVEFERLQKESTWKYSRVAAAVGFVIATGAKYGRPERLFGDEDADMTEEG